MLLEIRHHHTLPSEWHSRGSSLSDYQVGWETFFVIETINMACLLTTPLNYCAWSGLGEEQSVGSSFEGTIGFRALRCFPVHDPPQPSTVRCAGHIRAHGRDDRRRAGPGIPRGVVTTTRTHAVLFSVRASPTRALTSARIRSPGSIRSTTSLISRASPASRT